MKMMNANDEPMTIMMMIMMMMMMMMMMIAATPNRRTIHLLELNNSS